MQGNDPSERDMTVEGRDVFFKGTANGSIEAPTLEGRLKLPATTPPYPGVILCHANPKAGGNMDMGIMRAIERALASAGMAVLRYNSRGIGRSTGRVSGAHNPKLVAPEGKAEITDVGAALGFLASVGGVDGSRLALVGHSFGARIALAYLQQQPQDSRVAAVVCIGLAVAWGDLSHLRGWRGPRLFITGERDDFCPPALLEKYVASLPPPATQVTLKNTGHFFEGRESDLAAVVAKYLSGILLDDK